MISSFLHEAGRCQPAASPPPSGMPSPPGPPCPPPRCALAARTTNTSFVLWHGLETPGKRFSAPSVSCQRQYLRPMRCGGASQPSASWTQTEMSRCQHRPAGRGARLLLISRGAAFLGLLLPNSTLCFAMPVLHRCANHGSIGTCVVDNRKLGKPCGPVGEKRKEKTNGDRQSTRQGSRVEFVSTSLDLNLIPSLRGLEKKRCHALPSSLRSCEPSVWCP